MPETSSLRNHFSSFYQIIANLHPDSSGFVSKCGIKIQPCFVSFTLHASHHFNPPHARIGISLSSRCTQGQTQGL